MKYSIKQLIEFLDEMHWTINRTPGGLDCDTCPFEGKECQYDDAGEYRENCAWEQIKSILSKQ